MKNEDLRLDRGNRLRRYRLNKHLTQDQMAERLGISSKHYSEVERGKTGFSIDNWILAARILDADLNTLLDGPATTLKIQEEADYYLRDANRTLMQKTILERIFLLIEEYAKLCVDEKKES
ncbi:helix-turn-helix domain-containing protein [Dubosiella muris]|uniref:XRE family transcriptional regulator n=1 Tax=Dubosiella muris TaxID=3038133 RepID=A0AC61R5W4_9FIRM|nr:helix-turn-helix transcriptional regulator [Dubosiella muris]TGY64963.1 XRE family transcriptional regulator [Dubosiella muris]